MNIVIFGATSAIAKASARQWALNGASFTLIARDGKKLEIEKTDLVARGAKDVQLHEVDFSDLTTLKQKLSEIKNLSTQIDVLLIAQGVLPEQEKCSQEYQSFDEQFIINFNGIVLIIIELLEKFRLQKFGTIAVISSVAGDRGRKSNYAYGTAKAALNTFLQGLRNEVLKDNINVLTIKPGFVDTPMTANFQKGPLFVKPEKIATDIVKAVNSKKDVIYTPWFWYFIMLIIKSIPEKLFKRLSL